MSDNLRWVKFSLADYENDLPLLDCSLAAQGLWMRLLCFMHRADPYGHLAQNGKPCSLRQIAVLVRKTEAHVVPLLRELEQAGIFSRTETGMVFSRRMVSDQKQRIIDKTNGKKGGNPSLVQGKQPTAKTRKKKGVNPPVNPRVNPRVEKSRVEKKGTNANALVVGSADPTLPATVVAFPVRGASEEQAAFDAWNDMAAVTNVAKATTLDSDRRSKLRARLREAGGLDGWMVALGHVRASSLWQGRAGRGWRPTFDDILSKAKFRKLMEGGYDDAVAAVPATAPTARESLSARLEREEREHQAAIAIEARTIEASAL